jgi:hypothetical protein
MIFSLLRFPDSRVVRVHTRNFWIGVAGLTASVAIGAYAGWGGSFVGFAATIPAAIFTALTFVSVVGVIASSCTLAESKAARLITVLLVGGTGLAASAWLSTQRLPDRQAQSAF